MQTKRLLEASAAKLEADTKRLCEENEFLQQYVFKKKDIGVSFVNIFYVKTSLARLLCEKWSQKALAALLKKK